MAKTIGPDDLDRLARTSRALNDAETQTTRCREAYLQDRTDAKRQPWVDAIRAEKRAQDEWWETHREYFIEL